MHKKHSPRTISKNFRQQCLCCAVLAGLFIAAIACGKKDDGHSSSTEGHDDNPDEVLRVFNINLLDLSSEQEGMVFAFPVMKIHIDEAKPHVIDLQVVVNCTQSEVATELGDNTDKYKGIFDLVFSIRSRSQISNSANRMNIRDEIIERLERELRSNGFSPSIREIYFTKYHIHRSYQ